MKAEGKLTKQPKSSGKKQAMPTTKNAHCPICKRKMTLPVWAIDKYGDKFTAYCSRCKRIYTTKEILWK